MERTLVLSGGGGVKQLDGLVAAMQRDRLHVSASHPPSAHQKENGGEKKSAPRRKRAGIPPKIRTNFVHRQRHCGAEVRNETRTDRNFIANVTAEGEQNRSWMSSLAKRREAERGEDGRKPSPTCDILSVQLCQPLNSRSKPGYPFLSCRSRGDCSAPAVVPQPTGVRT